LLFTEDATPPAITQPYITLNGGEMDFNVATGNFFDFKINGSGEMNLSASVLQLTGGKNISGINSLLSNFSGMSIDSADSGWTYDVATGDTHTFRVNDTAYMTISSNTVNLPLTATITWDGDSDRRINHGTAGFIFEVPTTRAHEWQINGIQMRLTEGKLDIYGNLLDNIGGLILNTATDPASTEQFINNSAGSMLLNTAGSNSFIFNQGGSTKMRIESAEIDVLTASLNMNDNDIINIDTLEYGTGSLPAGTVAYTSLSGGRLRHNVPTASVHTFTVDGRS